MYEPGVQEKGLDGYIHLAIVRVSMAVKPQDRVSSQGSEERGPMRREWRTHWHKGLMEGSSRNERKSSRCEEASTLSYQPWKNLEGF